MICPKCEKETEHKHLHETAYGFTETHMSGSEHYECVVCGYRMFAEEGELQGLPYPLDGTNKRGT